MKQKKKPNHRKAIRKNAISVEPRGKRSDSKYEYLPADEEVVYHEGLEGLDVIRVKLPKPPPLKQVEGYGLHPDDQVFNRSEIPPKLAELNRQNFVDVEDYWYEIESNFEYYEDELWFIDRDWKRRKYGYWVFIQGKPTWITMWYFMYLHYYGFRNEIDGSLHPEYRDLDRKLFIARWYAAVTTEAPFKYKYHKEGGKVKYTSSDIYAKELANKGYTVEDKGYIVDFGDRVCNGTTEFKKRRGGYTSQCCNIGIEITTRMEKAKFALQSMTEGKASDIFENQVVGGYKGYPFWFKPVSENMVDPKRTMAFKPAVKKTGTGSGKKAKIMKALYSQMTYGSSTVGYFDGDKLAYWLSDEWAKTLEIDVAERTLVVRKTMSTGDNKLIKGYSNQVSTAGDLVKGGGSNAKKLAGMSHWGKRNDIGQTESGFINFFIPSDEGLETFVDKYGNSMKEEAREHIEAKRRDLKEKQKWNELNEEIRQAPLTWKENFISNTKQTRFNAYILEKRIADLTVGTNPFVIHGRFAWEKNSTHNYELKKLPTRSDFINKLDRVIFIPEDDHDFSWEFSWMPEPKDQNAFHIEEGTNRIIPANVGKASHGVDPFKYGEKTSSGAGSLGGGAVFRSYDSLVDNPHLDPMGINPKTGDFNHVTKRFCGTYLRRPILEEFLEQQLMCDLFFGIKSNHEINLRDGYRWYKDRGFEEYLFYDTDIETGEEKAKPGFETSTNMINSIFNAWAQHISQHGLREVHALPLIQANEIEDKMTDYDLFTACGYALIQDGSSRFIEIEQTETFDASSVFEFETID